MQVTNVMHLPQAFVDAVNVERHNKPGCYSATTLNKGTKEIILQERHWEEISIDASENVWALFGTAVHEILEKYNDGNFHEESFDIEVSHSRVTGTVDSYDMERGIINDWKTASVYKVMKGDFTDWYKQGMTYAWLLAQNGFNVTRCRFIAFLKDHSKSKARTDSSYPQSPVFRYQFDVTEAMLADAEKRIIAKVKDIEAAERLEDDSIQPCSPEERWADPDKYAVMKNGRKTAVKIFEDLIDAENYAGEQGNSFYVEHRQAISRKCADYCICKGFCSYYRNGGK